MLKNIIEKTGISNLPDILSKTLTTGELTTLLLDVYLKKTNNIKPHELMQSYADNRFARPSDIDPVLQKRIELEILQLFASAGYKPLELSPVTVLGAASAYGKVNQNNILTALRSCEVASDTSNVLLFELLKQYKPGQDNSLDVCSTQRVIRTNYFEQSKTMSSHFLLFTSASLIKAEEDDAVIQKVFEHLLLTYRVYREIFKIDRVTWQIRRKKELQQLGEKIIERIKKEKTLEFEVSDDFIDSSYYQGFQIKSFAWIKNEKFETGDCGLVNWAQQIRGDKRLHYFINGLGLERLIKLV